MTRLNRKTRWQDDFRCMARWRSGFCDQLDATQGRRRCDTGPRPMGQPAGEPALLPQRTAGVRVRACRKPTEQDFPMGQGDAQTETGDRAVGEQRNVNGAPARPSLAPDEQRA